MMHGNTKLKFKHSELQCARHDKNFTHFQHKILFISESFLMNVHHNNFYYLGPHPSPKNTTCWELVLFPLSDNNGGTSLSNCAFSTGPTCCLDSVSIALCLETGSTFVCKQQGNSYSHELVMSKIQNITWHATVSHLANESLKASKIKCAQFLLNHTCTNFHNSRKFLEFQHYILVLSLPYLEA